ncbi:hypothetical protein BC629DRAFT_1601427 [Irpex lacteus]|nr:hypothetical protein BC629DRAFT_1601427 [Irpex lacteus]
MASLSLYLDTRVKDSKTARSEVMVACNGAVVQPAEDNSASGHGGRRPRASVAMKPVAERYLIEELMADPYAVPTNLEPSAASLPSFAHSTSTSPPEGCEIESMSPAPDEITWIRPRRFKPSGTSALGVSVLSVRGKVNDPDAEDIDLRLDSGADVTLISSEFYHSLSKPPKLRQGRKMQLWQLTDHSSQIQGYIEVSIFFRE